MSENIQSISQGTYTIGQTSATNFVAGPGIKIDSPSAGTVRIGTDGTDETVLWSGTLTSGSTATLAENITNFERIAFEGYCHNGNTYSVYAEAPVISTAVRFGATTFWPLTPEVDFVKCECYNTTVKSLGTSIIYKGSTTNTSGTITKIYGINRKTNA